MDNVIKYKSLFKSSRMKDNMPVAAADRNAVARAIAGVASHGHKNSCVPVAFPSSELAAVEVLAVVVGAVARHCFVESHCAVRTGSWWIHSDSRCCRPPARGAVPYCCCHSVTSTITIQNIKRTARLLTGQAKPKISCSNIPMYLLELEADLEIPFHC